MADRDTNAPINLPYTTSHFPDKSKGTEISATDMTNIAKALKSLVNHSHTYLDTYDQNCNCNCACSRGIV